MSRGGFEPNWVRVLAGLEAGILGGLLGTGWFLAAAWWKGLSFWTIPNLMGGLFYGWQAIRPDFGLHTLAGLALHFLMCGAVGMMFGAVAPRDWSRMRLLLAGLALAGGCDLLTTQVLWKRWNPALAMFLRQLPPSPVWLFLGGSLGLYWMFARSGARSD